VLSTFLDNKSFDFAEWLIYSWGTSIACLLGVGLVVNTIGLASHHNTLTQHVLLPVVDVVVLLFMIAQALRRRDGNSRLYPAFFSSKKLKHIARVLVSVLIPLIALLGVVRLNNGGTNNLAIVALILMCLYPIVLIGLKKIYKEELIISLFAIGIALALSVSMRTNYLVGFDIHHEYQVFIATANSGLWHPHASGSVYNACLSITILPTVFKVIMPISAMYVFKFVMQLLFGVLPIIVFVIARRRSMKMRLAYICALFFIVQGQYIFEFPALVRQQVALVLFGLIFASASSKSLSKVAKSILLIVFGLAMVVSHYSTTYVTIALLTLIVCLRPIFGYARMLVAKKLSRPSPQHIQGMSCYISPIIVVIIMLTAFLWYGETLQATGGIGRAITGSITNFSSIFNSDSHSSFVNTTFGGSDFSYNQTTLEQVAAKQAVPSGYHTTSAQYQPQPASSNGIVVTNSIERALLDIEHKFIPILAGLTVGLGLLYMVISALSGSLTQDEGLLATGAACLFLLLAVLPNLSQDYNLERLYQQVLILVSPALIYGLGAVFTRWFPKRIIVGFAISITILYLIGTTGLMDQAIFHTANINLNNNGSSYDEYNVTSGDITSLDWIERVMNPNDHINFDRYSALTAYAYGTIPTDRISQGQFPSQISKSSYVYASSTNLKNQLTYDTYQDNTLVFLFPGQYLQSQKNTIYVNQDSEIYQ
jgi:uncharacterized membrane protein